MFKKIYTDSDFSANLSSKKWTYLNTFLVTQNIFNFLSKMHRPST